MAMPKAPTTICDPGTTATTLRAAYDQIGELVAEYIDARRKDREASAQHLQEIAMANATFEKAFAASSARAIQSSEKAARAWRALCDYQAQVKQTHDVTINLSWLNE